MRTDYKTTYTRMLTVQTWDWLQNYVQENANSSKWGLSTKTTYKRMLTIQNGDWQQNNIHENVKSSKWGLTTKQCTQEC